MSGWQQEARFQKECGCIAHSVPCWLWLDRMDRERTREYLDIMCQRLSEYEAAPSWLERQRVLTAVAGVAAVDLPRVRRKLAMMRHLGIDTLPDDLVAQVEAEWVACRALNQVPPTPPSAQAVREQLREVALSLEMAASPKEKAHHLAELVRLDRQLREIEAPL